MTYAREHLAEARRIIDQIDPDAIERVADVLAAVRERGGRLFFLGVGGSAANCSHAVNDFRKIAGFEAYAPTDNVSELTARTNDDGWASVFVDEESHPVVVASESRPLPAVTLTEVLATSDVPGGVVNVLTGLKTELVPVLAGHVDVDAIDVWGVPDDLRTDVELVAADNVKRLARRPAGAVDAKFDWLDDRAAERPEWIAAFLEMKTVWHPIGV